jgi:hypothetical protein
MDLVRTDCADDKIRDAIVGAAGGETSAIEEALVHVQDMQREPHTYVTDRAIRVFTAAAQGGPVSPVDSSHAKHYERERNLEKLPRDAAVAELGRLSPAVRRYCEGVLQKKRNRYGKASRIRSVLEDSRMEKEVDALVGPKSDADDPLLRSPIASGIVMSWVRDVTGITTVWNGMKAQRGKRAR